MEMLFLWFPVEVKVTKERIRALLSLAKNMISL